MGLMRRRDFIRFLGGAATCLPLTAHGQQPGRLPTIAFLGVDDSSWGLRTSAFAQRLREQGWIEDRTVLIRYYWTQGRPERVVELAAEILSRKVDVIVTYGGAVTTLKQATTVVPIVFAIANDPIGSGLVSNLSRPGGNVTGLSLEVTEIAGKRLQLLHDTVPHLRRLGVIFDVGYSASVLQRGEVQAAAQTLSVEVEPIKIRRAQDIAPSFEALSSHKVDALYVVENALVQAKAERSPRSRSAPDYQRSSVHVIKFKRVGLCRTAPNIPIYFGGPPRSPTRFYAGKSLLISQSKNRPPLNLYSISRPLEHSA